MKDVIHRGPEHTYSGQPPQDLYVGANRVYTNMITFLRLERNNLFGRIMTLAEGCVDSDRKLKAFKDLLGQYLKDYTRSSEEMLQTFIASGLGFKEDSLVQIEGLFEELE